MAEIEHIIRQPEGRRHKHPIFLQHGAWHGAWCWDEWLDYLPTLGYEVHAISLPGHGRSPAERHINRYSLDDYVAVMAAEIEKVSPRPIVIGHSMGGALVQRYLNEHKLPAAVLLATLPHAGSFWMGMRGATKFFWPHLRGYLTWNLYEWVRTPELARRMFLSADTAVDVDAFHAKLVRESMHTGLRTIFPYARADKRTPVLVVAAGRDNIFTVAEEKATAAAYNGDFVLFPDQAHNLMMESKSRQVADTIDGWIKNWRPPAK